MADRSRKKEGFMSRILKFLTFIAASLMAQMAIAQVSYQYTGTPFKLFCGPTPVCIADPSGTRTAVLIQQLDAIVDVHHLRRLHKRVIEILVFGVEQMVDAETAAEIPI